MRHDPKLLEALARWRGCSHHVAEMNSERPCDGCLSNAHQFVAKSNLVQLPEPNGWEAEYTGPLDDVPRWGKGYHLPFKETPTGRTRPFWIIYGPPEEGKP